MRRMIALGLLLAGCGSARRGVPLVGPLELSAEEGQGKILFMHDCHQCHPGGEAAVGPAINNKPIPRLVMTLQIRKGVLGSMPAFSGDELSDKEVSLILDYIEAMRKHRP